MVFCGKESEDGFACFKKGIGTGIMLQKQKRKGRSDKGVKRGPRPKIMGKIKLKKKKKIKNNKLFKFNNSFIYINYLYI